MYFDDNFRKNDFNFTPVTYGANAHYKNDLVGIFRNEFPETVRKNEKYASELMLHLERAAMIKNIKRQNQNGKAN